MKLSNVFKTLLPAIFLATTLTLPAQNQTPQDVNVDVNLDGGGTWYGNWWMWAIGLAVFIIIIVAIVSAGRRRA